jgi:heat-inducible transcriptional repressor
MTLAPRQKALLGAVIERYVENAEPVGSAALAGDERFRALCGTISTATIRNDLAELESLGLVMQPHTSAGRVPTDAGYRFYVNEMLRPRPLRSRERAQIRTIPASPSSIEDVLREATALLAQLTGYPAVATLPLAGRDTMRQVQIAPVPPHRLLLVLLTQSGRVENRLFEVGPEEMDARHIGRLNTVVNFLNEQLHGRSLSEVRTLGFEAVSSGLHDEATLALARRAWEQVRASVNDLGDERLVVQGVVTLLDEPEFSDIAHARSAMRLFDNGDALSDLLASHVNKETSTRAIVIGREHIGSEGDARVGVSGVERLSFVGIAYGNGGEVLGAVGVMGPTRMKYAEAATLVPALAARLQTSLESL